MRQYNNWDAYLKKSLNKKAVGYKLELSRDTEFALNKPTFIYKNRKPRYRVSQLCDLAVLVQSQIYSGSRHFWPQEERGICKIQVMTYLGETVQRSIWESAITTEL